MIHYLSAIAASRRRSSSAYDVDFADYLARGITNGGTMTTDNQIAVNAWFVGAKSDGFFSAIKAACLLAAWDNLAGILTPIVGTAPTNSNFVSGDYSRTTGLLGNGSNKALTSNRADNASPQNSNHFSVYVTAAPGSTDRFFGGTFSGSSHTSLYSTGTVVGGRNRVIDAFSAYSSASPTGFIGTNRSSSSGYSVRGGGNTYSKTIASVAPTTTVIQIYKAGGLAGYYSNARISFYSIGESIDLALLDARLVTLMSALT